MAPHILQAEYNLLRNLQDIINTMTDHYEFQGEYISIVHQVHNILQRKYKFNLKDSYISDHPAGVIMSRTTESVNPKVIS